MLLQRRYKIILFPYYFITILLYSSHLVSLLAFSLSYLFSFSKIFSLLYKCLQLHLISNYHTFCFGYLKLCMGIADTCCMVLEVYLIRRLHAVSLCWSAADGEANNFTCSSRLCLCGSATELVALAR